MIEIKNIHKSYGSLEVLKGIDAVIEQGEIVSIVGASGAGKTTLLQAITGVNADRLPEEKKRGMTIDLGYAYWPQPDGRVPGFIDVPGHEKFLSNMLAGVGGIER